MCVALYLHTCVQSVCLHSQCEVVSFDNCLVYFCSSVFDDNYSSTESDSETDGDTSALAAFRFPVTFNGTNHFVVVVLHC